MSTENEFPLNFQLDLKEEKIEPQVKKLLRFFRYVENYQNSKVDVDASGYHLFLFVRDSEITIDYDGEITIKAPSLRIEIYRSLKDNVVSIHGDADGFEFEISFKGKISLLAREGRVMLTFKVKSLPEISRC